MLESYLHYDHHINYGVCKINNGKQLTVYEHFALVSMWTKVRHVAWKSLVRIFSLAPKLSGLRRCILSQFLNFHD